MDLRGWGIYNGTWTEGNAIYSEIIPVISKSNQCTAWFWFEITSMISDQNCNTQSSITSWLYPFWKHKIQSLNYRIFYYPIFGKFFLSPLIWLVTINKPWHLMGCCVLLKVFRWLGKRCNLEQKMVWFMNKLHWWELMGLQGSQWFQNECNKKYKTHLYPLFPGTSFPSWSSIFGPIFWKKKKLRK